MREIKDLSEIETIKVHWSENTLINDDLGCDDNGDIEKYVDVDEFAKLIKKAAKKVGVGYDKTSLSVFLKDGTVFADANKFNLTSKDTSLINLLNK